MIAQVISFCFHLRPGFIWAFMWEFTVHILSSPSIQLPYKCVTDDTLCEDPWFPCLWLHRSSTFVNKWDLIQGANHILISADRPRQDITVPVSPSACLGGWLWRERHANLWLLCRWLRCLHPPWLLGRHSEHSHPLTRCEGEQITPASRRDGWREEKGGRRRTEQIEMRGILFHFDC